MVEFYRVKEKSSARNLIRQERLMGRKDFKQRVKVEKICVTHMKLLEKINYTHKQNDKKMPGSVVGNG